MHKYHPLSLYHESYINECVNQFPLRWKKKIHSLSRFKGWSILSLIFNHFDYANNQRDESMKLRVKFCYKKKKYITTQCGISRKINSTPNLCLNHSISRIILATPLNKREANAIIKLLGIHCVGNIFTLFNSIQYDTHAFEQLDMRLLICPWNPCPKCRRLHNPLKSIIAIR